MVFLVSVTIMLLGRKHSASHIILSYERSGTKLMVVDIQGSSFQLYDPEIATSSLHDDSQFLFCTGNLAHIAIENFVCKHKCTTFCTLAGLSALSA